MTHEVVGEYDGGRLEASTGHVGRFGPGEEFGVVWARVGHGGAFGATSFVRPGGWIVVTVRDSAGEVGLIRMRNGFWEPLARAEILLSGRAGVRVGVGVLHQVLPIGATVAWVPEPFERALRFRRRFSGITASWEGCGDDRLDRMLVTLAALRFWMEPGRG